MGYFVFNLSDNKFRLALEFMKNKETIFFECLRKMKAMAQANKSCQKGVIF